LLLLNPKLNIPVTKAASIPYHHPPFFKHLAYSYTIGK